MKQILFTIAFCITVLSVNSANNLNWKLDNLITTYSNQDRFQGVVLVAQHGKKILSKGYGKANIEWNINNSPNHKYMLASVSKTLTATLIMRLIDNKKLSMETYLSDALPWYNNPNGSKITIRQLLNHTSGIPNYMNLAEQSVDDVNREFGTMSINKIEFVNKYCSKAPEYTPGSKWMYNNTAYFLLGMIIEEITGKTYSEAMTEYVFRPLGMTSSGDIQPDQYQIIQSLATGYIKRDHRKSHMQYWNLSSALGAGSIYSTLDDLLKFDQALNTSFISETSKRAMFTPELGNYGCGWEIRKANIGDHQTSRIIQTHEGFMWGWNNRIYRIPEDGVFIVIISNGGNAPLEKMFSGITDLIYGRETILPLPSIVEEVAKKRQSTTMAKAIAYGKELISVSPKKWDINTDELNNYGYECLTTGNTNDALQLFEWNTILYPNSWNAWDSYGEGLILKGNTTDAIQAYKKSIELNPDNQSGKDILKKIISLKKEDL